MKSGKKKTARPDPPIEVKTAGTLSDDGLRALAELLVEFSDAKEAERLQPSKVIHGSDLTVKQVADECQLTIEHESRLCEQRR